LIAQEPTEGFSAKFCKQTRRPQEKRSGRIPPGEGSSGETAVTKGIEDARQSSRRDERIRVKEKQKFALRQSPAFIHLDRAIPFLRVHETSALLLCKIGSPIRTSAIHDYYLVSRLICGNGSEGRRDHVRLVQRRDDNRYEGLLHASFGVSTTSAYSKFHLVQVGCPDQGILLGERLTTFNPSLGGYSIPLTPSLPGRE
jgi:hypothetical protein